MYAKIESTTWELNQPAKSCVAGTDGEYAFEFEHELGCPVQGSYQDCTCYVSRIRLVKTPVGRIIPTTEEDLLPHLEYRRAFAEQMRLSAEHWERQAWIARGLFLAMGIAGAVIGAL